MPKFRLSQDTVIKVSLEHFSDGDVDIMLDDTLVATLRGGESGSLRLYDVSEVKGVATDEKGYIKVEYTP